MGALPFLRTIVRPSAALVRSTVLELLILTVHVLLYPTGLAQERRPPPPPAVAGPRGDQEGDGEDRPPVLLLHGFIDNRSVFVLLRRSLRRHGWQHVLTLNFSLLTCDVRAAAELLARHVEEVCDRTGSPQVDVVGHSLGGLIARYYVQRMGGDARVRMLVTLGTPHAGTHLAGIVPGHPLARQMRPDSEIVAELGEPAPQCGTQFVSFWSDLDLIMIPVETARIDHPDLISRSVRVSGVGHLALPVHTEVAVGIRQALTMAETTDGRAGAASVA
ncbi:MULTISPECIES: esterase/lipase family protein [Streptomyces]|uniref:Alpha/beta fold hydrolase n=1 Tax=Streptomyces morookaense TaxID=1970 RepID=A0A7Y7B1F8_STRMO|nr:MULTISPECIES: alpha/beta fold hydrolase [Streptomyces]MCC2278811.1 alpha/beta fold hydrolase [Streptomyces sp. ET3-23]NVK77172.1 alpha/beta fold hydrolase [Streptomyces morookaense]GHF17261.1 lipase [Streptomyces morookaense]